MRVDELKAKGREIDGVYYIEKIPETIPDGYVLVHNHIAPPRKRIGIRGFRAWLAKADDPRRVVLCDCAWGKSLNGLPHYKVAR